MFAMLDGVGVVDWMTEACLGWMAFDQAVQTKLFRAVDGTPPPPPPPPGGRRIGDWY